MWWSNAVINITTDFALFLSPMIVDRLPTNEAALEAEDGPVLYLRDWVVRVCHAGHSVLLSLQRRIIERYDFECRRRFFGVCDRVEHGHCLCLFVGHEAATGFPVFP
ncbi:hypothetical protein B0T14DRAFT_576758, partial [Immersiella caudata]